MKPVRSKRYLNWYRIGVVNALKTKYHDSIDLIHWVCTVLCPNFRQLPFPVNNDFKTKIYNILRCIIYWYPQETDPTDNTKTKHT